MQAEHEAPAHAGRMPATQRAGRPRYVRWTALHFCVAHASNSNEINRAPFAGSVLSEAKSVIIPLTWLPGPTSTY